MAPTQTTSHRRARRRRLASAVLLALAVSTAGATGAGATIVHPAAGGFLGIAARASGPSLAAARSAAPTVSFDTLPSGYAGAVDRYFNDVAAAGQPPSPATDNVYSVIAQYGSQPPFDSPSVTAMVQSSFGGEIDDSASFPSDANSGNTAGGCLEPATARKSDPAYTWCLTDAQIQAELSSVIAARQLPRDLSAAYFVMLGPGVDVCGGPGPESQPSGSNQGNPCADTDFCAYHSSFADSSGNPQAPVYAVIPWPNVSGCQSGEAPNAPSGGGADDPGDDAANVISHEHNEILTDPLGSGWYADTGGWEVADLCAPTQSGQNTLYGPALGGSVGTNAYNQTINGHNYWLQEEFSLGATSCEQRPGANSGSTPSNAPLSLPTDHGGPVVGAHTTYAIYWDPAQGGQNPSAAFSASATTAHVGQSLSFTAAATSDPQGQRLSYYWSFGDGATITTSQSSISHVFSLPGAHAVALTVSDPDGYAATSDQTITVYQPPTASFTGPTGPARAGQPAAFNGISSGGPDGTIQTWSWSFGDGQRAGGSQVKHVYARAGLYTVTLTVTDSNGSTGSESQTLQVLAPLAATIARVGSLRVSLSHGHVLVLTGRSVSCPAAAPGCSVTVSLTARVATAARGSRRSVTHTVKLGAITFTLRAGRGRAVVLQLSRAGVSLLRRVRHLSGTLVVAAYTQGGEASGARATLKLRAPRGLV